MRILFLEGHDLWINGLPNGFRDIGHEVLTSRIKGIDSITTLISEFRPELIIMLGWTEEHIVLKRKWIREQITNSNIPFIYWATEDPIHTEVFTKPFIKQVLPSFVFTVSKEKVAYYEKLGFKSAYMDFGYHPSVHKKVAKVSEYACQIAVVANAYPGVIKVYPEFYRLKSLSTLITPLLRAGIKIDFWGTRWPEMEEILGCEIPSSSIHGYISYREAYKVYCSADIILGLQNTASQLTMRTYEVLGSGGFLITSDTRAVREVFIPDRDLVVSSSPQETLELVRYYISHPKDRLIIGEQGQRTVVEHNYTERAKYMLNVLYARNILPY